MRVVGEDPDFRRSRPGNARGTKSTDKDTKKTKASGAA